MKGSTVRSSLTGAPAAIAMLAAAFVVWHLRGPRPVTVSVGQFPEQLVFVRSSDDVVNGGAMFQAPKNPTGRLAILWIHGWGANFYSPTYVMIGRALAARGLTTI